MVGNEGVAQSVYMIGGEATQMREEGKKGYYLAYVLSVKLVLG